MKKSFAVVLLVVVAAWAIWFSLERSPSSPSGDGPHAVVSPGTTQAPGLGGKKQIGTAFNWTLPAGPAREMGPNATPAQGVNAPHFAADRQGRLILNTDTHDQMERLLALNDKADARRLLQEIETALPPEAARQLADLFNHYEQYISALAQSYPPGTPPASLQAAEQQLDGIHQLRVDNFGANIAAALFGNDEATAQQLLNLMRSQSDPSLSVAQQAQLAQQAYSKLPHPTTAP